MSSDLCIPAGPTIGICIGIDICISIGIGIGIGIGIRIRIHVGIHIRIRVGIGIVIGIGIGMGFSCAVDPTLLGQLLGGRWHTATYGSVEQPALSCTICRGAQQIPAGIAHRQQEADQGL